MSTSLKVVRMAALDWACSSRSATRLRSGVIFTRSSRAAFGPGARGGRARRRGERHRRRGRGLAAFQHSQHVVLRDPAGDAAAAAATAGPGLRLRPSCGPPATAGAAVRCRRLRAARRLAGRAAAGGGRCGGAAGGAAAAFAAAAMVPSTSPIFTRSPSAWRDGRQRACGRRGDVDRHLVGLQHRPPSRPAVTASPTFLCHLPTTASVIDSPSAGTVSSTAIGSPPRKCLVDELALLELVRLERSPSPGWRSPPRPT